MCLYQVAMQHERTPQSGRLCANNQTLLVVEHITGSFNANGIVGLAPSNDERSLVKKLKDSGQIDKAIVSLNYEDPSDSTQASTITFGEIDPSQIKGGEEGMNYYSNVGQGEWALLIDHLIYSGEHTHEEKEGAHVVLTKQALIDSSNSSIQIPDTMFDNILKRMQTEDGSIGVHELSSDRRQIVSSKSCSEIEANLGEIAFHI